MKPASQVIRNKQNHSILISPKDPKNSLVWLHGLGDSSEGFLDYFLDSNSPVQTGTRVLLLQAPLRAVTINGGSKCNSWYDIKGFNSMKEEDSISIQEVKQSVEIISKGIDSEVKFWETQSSTVPPHRRVFIGGFSQGCAMSLYYGLQTAKPLPGIIGFSGLLFQSTMIKNLGPTKVLLYHGQQDQMIPIQLARLSYQKQSFQTNQNVKFTAIPNLGHSVDMNQLVQARDWINNIYAHQEKKSAM